MSLNILVCIVTLWGRRPDDLYSIFKMMELNFSILTIGWLLRWSKGKFPYPWCTLSTFDLSSKRKIDEESDSRYGIIYEMLMRGKKTVEIGKGVQTSIQLTSLLQQEWRLQIRANLPHLHSRKGFYMWRSTQILWLCTIAFSCKTSKCC